VSDKTGIEWTEATWNPVTGCAKVSQGCKNCYALREWPRMAAAKHTVYFGREFTDVQCHPERLDQPLRWRRPRRIFVNSMSDLFHADVPDEFIDRVFAIMGLCFAMERGHTFQVLTKRTDRMRQYLSNPDTVWMVTRAMKALGPELPGENSPPTWPLPNVWLGVSVEDQETADERIPLLLDTPAAVRWISAEPLLGPVDLLATPAGDILCRCGGCMEMTRDTRLDWVIVGGESGPKARPMSPDWARGLRDQCAAAGVPFMFKQWGEWLPTDDWYEHHPVSLPLRVWHGGAWTDNPEFDGEWMARIGKRSAGRLLDGVQHDGYPQSDGDIGQLREGQRS
jgi:protein gp37